MLEWQSKRQGKEEKMKITIEAKEETITQLIEEIATINARKYEPRQRIRAVQDNRGVLYAFIDWCDSRDFSIKVEKELLKKIRMLAIYDCATDELSDITLQFMF